MSDVNIPLLRKAVEWAEAEAAKPEIDRKWHQGMWVADPENRAWEMLETTHGLTDGHVEQVATHCGTTYCIAGYIGQALDARYAADDVVDDIHVSQYAADALGISGDWGVPGHLFQPQNTIEDVRRIAEDLAGERL